LIAQEQLIQKPRNQEEQLPILGNFWLPGFWIYPVGAINSHADQAKPPISAT